MRWNTTIVSIVVVSLAIVVIIMWLLVTLQRSVPFGRDAWAYYAAAQAIAAGGDPYAAAPIAPTAPPYLYPPLLALLLAPLALLPLDALALVWQTIVLLSLLTLIPLLRPFLGWRTAAIAVLCFLPTWQTFYDGQINGIIAILLVAAVLGVQRGAHGQAGAALALGALLKITPITTLLVLTAQRNWRAVAAAVMTVIAVVGVTLPIVGVQAWLDGSISAVQSERADAGLRSLSSIVYTVSGSASVVPMLGVAVPIILITLWRSRHIPLSLALAAGILIPLLIARIVWEHHAVMALPALALLWAWHERTRALATGAWLIITLFGGIGMPLALTACWLACLWPASYIRLLTPQAALSTSVATDKK
jgi:alpha-1,2-mannosyltransferase